LLRQLALLAGGLSVVACGEVNGAQPLAGAAHYAPSDGAWSLQYLSPPWLLVHGDGETAALAVAPSLLSIDVAHATVTLAIEPKNQAAGPSAANALAAWKSAHPSGSAPAVPTQIDNRAGQAGVEFAASDGMSFHREAFFDAQTGCFSLVFEGRVPVDTADVTSLIAGFETK